MRNSYYR